MSSSSNALRKNDLPPFADSPPQVRDVEVDFFADGRTGSPVHEMQIKLEAAVFASFSAKEQVKSRSVGKWRAVALVLGASLGGWALFAAGTMVHFY